MGVGEPSLKMLEPKNGLRDGVGRGVEAATTGVVVTSISEPRSEARISGGADARGQNGGAEVRSGGSEPEPSTGAE